MRFEKWHGLGNDFILVERDVTPDAARRICDRHRGVGADGVLCLTLKGSKTRMVIFNADGSRPEMCGNGVRCASAFMAHKHNRKAGRLVIQTDAGDRVCEASRLTGEHFEVGVEMGQAKVGLHFSFPPDGPGAQHEFIAVDLGNPHAVTFDPVTAATIDEVGPALAAAGTSGNNVEFCKFSDEGRGLEVVVWERGVGRTLACGTGACAAAAAAVAAGHWHHDEEIPVHLPGGVLRITVRPEGLVNMRGPAERIFSGELHTRV